MGKSFWNHFALCEIHKNKKQKNPETEKQNKTKKEKEKDLTPSFK